MKLTQDFIEKVLNTDNELYFINYDRKYTCIFKNGGVDDYYTIRAITGRHQLLLDLNGDVSFWNFDDFGKSWGFSKEELEPELARVKEKYELWDKEEQLKKELGELNNGKNN